MGVRVPPLAPLNPNFVGVFFILAPGPVRLPSCVSLAVLPFWGFETSSKHLVTFFGELLTQGKHFLGGGIDCKRALNEVLDASITGVYMSSKPATVMDLSKIDFEALTKRFKKSKTKNTDLEVLKTAIRAQLERYPKAGQLA